MSVLDPIPARPVPKSLDDLDPHIWGPPVTSQEVGVVVRSFRPPMWRGESCPVSRIDVETREADGDHALVTLFFNDLGRLRMTVSTGDGTVPRDTYAMRRGLALFGIILNDASLELFESCDLLEAKDPTEDVPALPEDTPEPTEEAA